MSPTYPTVHPRVGGETDDVQTASDTVVGPSPRGRGNPMELTAEERQKWSIPAWAGKPDEGAELFTFYKVHPRVGGETYRSCTSSVSR